MKTKMYTLSEVAELSAIELRKLRYCADHQLVPEHAWQVSEDEAGRPRSFSQATAVLLACAVYLQQAGIRREAVKWSLGWITQFVKPKPILNIQLVGEAVELRKQCTIYAADFTHVRVVTAAHDTGWYFCPPKSGSRRLDGDFRPVVTITVDVLELAQKIFG